jgi:hypothetical protein
MRIGAVRLTTSGINANRDARLDAMGREEMFCPIKSAGQRSNHLTASSVPASHAVVTRVHFGDVSYEDIH